MNTNELLRLVTEYGAARAESARVVGYRNAVKPSTEEFSRLQALVTKWNAEADRIFGEIEAATKASV